MIFERALIYSLCTHILSTSRWLQSSLDVDAQGMMRNALAVRLGVGPGGKGRQEGQIGLV